MQRLFALGYMDPISATKSGDQDYYYMATVYQYNKRIGTDLSGKWNRSNHGLYSVLSAFVFMFFLVCCLCILNYSAIDVYFIQSFEVFDKIHGHFQSKTMNSTN